MSGRAGSEAQDLIDPLHYLRNALEPFAEVIEAPLADMLGAAPDVLILADVGSFGEGERAALTEWVERGGLLLRFAGPRLAASGAGQLEADPLLPVRLRVGGRSVGGAMSWGAPRRLQPFPEDGPFAGLGVARGRGHHGAGDGAARSGPSGPRPRQPRGRHAARHRRSARRRPGGAGARDGERGLVEPAAVGTVRAHARAADPERRRARRRRRGARGRGLDAAPGAERLRRPRAAESRRGRSGRAARIGAPVGGDAAGRLRQRRTARGAQRDAVGRRAGRAWPTLPPGVVVEALERGAETRLGPWLLALALALLALDVLATLALSGRLRGVRLARGAAAAMLAAALAASGAARAQAVRDDATALLAANETVLAYVETGNARVDGVSEAGLAGLSQALFERTAIEPGAADGGRSRSRRPGAVPVPLLADHREPADALGRGLRQAQRLPALRRHDPVRHPGRAARRRSRREHAERAGAAAHRVAPRRAAARTGPVRPRADAHLLPAAGLSRSVDGRARSGSRRRRRPRRSRDCRSATSTTASRRW